MNLVTFSIRTKGLHNFARRLWTVFTRFGVSERQTRRALFSIMNALKPYQAAPTFFIPAVVLRRHAGLITDVVDAGAEVGIHGYVHNDYRYLSLREQDAQTHRAMSVFQEARIPFQGFRNPYLGWNEDALRVFAGCGFSYESNEAVLHEVIAPATLSPLLRGGYEKSLALFQAIPCTTYALRPHFEEGLLRIPISIPDDEMLFDRLRITNPLEVGRLWSAIMQRVYAHGGLYTLNLHPERGVLCKSALDALLASARGCPLPVWVTRLDDIARWWEERSAFELRVTPLTGNRWQVEATCAARATILARYLTVEEQTVTPWFGVENRVPVSRFIACAAVCPCIGLSPTTPQTVGEFLREQGYAFARCCQDDATRYALYLDLPQGLGATREEQSRQRCALVERIEQLEKPLVRFGCWPDGARAALSVTGDIDSVTIQDFFRRVLEVQK